MANVVSRTIEVCVFRKEKGEVRYLLLKRADDEPLYPGMWQLVTGSVKEGEHAVRAAVREFQEETGLEVLRFWVVPYVNSFYVAENDTVHASPLFAVEIEEGREPRLSHEHQSFKWCSYEEATVALVWPGQRFGLQIVHEYIVGGQEASRLLSLQV